MTDFFFQVYVCALAILDLLAALLVMPRDLMTMTFRSTRTLGPTFDLNAYCKAVSFFGFALHWAAGFILLAIATCRYLKVMRLRQVAGHGGQITTSRCADLSRFVSSHRGAKVTSLVIVAGSCVLSLPSLALYGNVPGERCFFQLLNGSMPTPSSVSCYLFCGIQRKTEGAVAFYAFNAVLFAGVAVALLTLYIIACCRVQALDTSDLSSCGQPPQAVGSSPDMTRFQLSTGAVEAVSMRRTDSQTIILKARESTFQRNDPGVNNESGIMPPEVYGPQVVSSPPLTSDDNSKGDGDEDSPGVFQMSVHSALHAYKWRKSKLRGATLTLVTITIIYIMSYIPFIFLSFKNQLDENRCSNLSAGSVMVTELFGRSFFIANAANPIVYGFCNNTFRRLLWKTLIWRREVF